ncbi:MAG: hypothetical protein GWP19_02080 [Planctomycetia bacterium]|nr:hypothetical protein [Planctomycetia bacterium]
MERIIKGYFNKFIEEFEYENEESDVSVNFEKFCAYVILKNALPSLNFNEEDINNVNVGKYKGIDSICFIVNGKLISYLQEVEDLLSLNGYLEVSLIFIQSKTSEKFGDSEIGNFGDTVKDFLEDNSSYPQTTEARDYHEILLFLYDHFAEVKVLNCVGYFCTTGKWDESTTCQTTLQKKITEINSAHDTKFKNGYLKISALGSPELQKLYEKAYSPIIAEFDFINKIQLSDLPQKINDAYYGSVPFSEYKKIIIDPETGNLRNLFYDNVRDDLGEKNPVNVEISKTLDKGEFSTFVLLNNGVTIIAAENKGGGNKFILDNFQIVNGCQTSNVLYRHKDDENIDNLRVPIKLIITNDEDIKDKIIVATNKQTEIKEEQLMALSTFQKGLEKFYESMSDEIHYERRLNQFFGSNYKKKSIIGLREQIKSFVAIFLEEPHLVSGYFGRTFREKKDYIFLEKHKYDPYYFSGLIQYKFKELLNKKEIDRKYNKARYHVFMLFRKIHEPFEFNTSLLQQKKMSDYIEELSKLLDVSIIKTSFVKALEVVDKSGIDIDNQKEIYKKSTTNTLLDTYKETYK